VGGGALLPLSRRTWLEVREPARLVVREGGLLAGAAAWEGLAALHELALRFTGLVAARAEAADRERMERRALEAQATLSRSCSLLAATLAERGDPAAGAGAGVLEGGDPLLAACGRVAAALGLTVKAEPRAEGARAARDPLAAILRASRLRGRKVALRADWWRHDQGPLLGYRAQDRHPVALLGEPGGYLLDQGDGNPPRRVTEALAAGLEPFGYTFYRPFPSSAVNLKDVLAFGLQGCRRDLAALVLAGGAAAVLGVVPAIATGLLFNTVIPGAQRSQLLQMTIVLLSCAAAMVLFNLARGVALLRIEGRMATAVQAAVWDRLLSLPLSFFRSYTAGDLAVRAMSIDAMRQLVSGSTIAAITGGLLSFTNVALMFHYQPGMAAQGTLLIALAVAVTAAGSVTQLRRQRAAARLHGRISGLVLQLLSSVGKLRVAGAEVHAFAQWARLFSEQRLLQFGIRSAGSRLAAFHACFPLLAYLLIFRSALPQLGSGGGLPTGDFLAFLAAFSTSLGALLATCTALLGTLNLVSLYEQAQPILATLPETDTGRADPGSLVGDIEVQHAVFRYQADGPVVLRDVSFRARAGEFVAFVGPSGSGKSTLLRLMLGFEELESGSIHYDGQEIAGLDIHAVRRQVGVVLQTGRLLAGDIFTNIVGSAPASIDEAWEAARMAGLADDIAAMPMGMHTVVSEGGGTLSGGQRQRLLIARAIVHRPRLLFFDEATSALDNRTQAVVTASLARLQATRIVIAHRLSTIAGADRIYVVDRGRIVESGRYQELLENGGLFAELARRQLA
jgi:NHLM bacteriocin system ABC transporter ATP-binding protein